MNRTPIAALTALCVHASACENPPAVRGDASVLREAPVPVRDASALRGTAASTTFQTVAVALARAGDDTLVLVRREPRGQDEEIRPTIGGMPIAAAQRSPQAHTHKQVIARTPDDRLLRVRATSVEPVAVEPDAASLAITESRALFALPSDAQQLPAMVFTGERWRAVDAALQALLRVRLGAGDLQRAIDVDALVADDTQPAMVLQSCRAGEHPFAGRLCALYALASPNADTAAIEALTDTVSATRINGRTVALRPRCADPQQATRCPLEAHTIEEPSSRPARLGMQSMRAIDGRTSPGWRTVVAAQNTVVAAWSSRDNDRDPPRFSLRVARLDGRRWTALPAIASEDAVRGYAVGGEPLTVVWSSEANVWSVSTFAAARWITTRVPASGTLVDAMVHRSTVTLLVNRSGANALLLRRTAGDSAWHSAELVAD